jgi:hypothetical protein
MWCGWHFGGKSEVERERFAACAGIREIGSIQRIGTFKYRIADGSSVPQKVALLQAQRIVYHALPNPIGPWPRSGDSPGNFADGELSVKVSGEFPDVEWSDNFAEAHGLRVISRTPETGWFWFEIADGLLGV